MSDNDLTPDERKVMDTLPREKMPSAGLEDRVASALRRRRLLRSRPRAFVLSRSGVAVLAAAAFAFVIGGFALGQWVTLRQVTSSQSALFDSTPLGAAASLQYAATAYLLALENIATMPDSTSPGSADHEDMRQGREVALATLSSAANQVSQIVPKRFLAGQLLQAIEVTEPGRAAPDSAVVWF